jgi:hypothetical protein
MSIPTAPQRRSTLVMGIEAGKAPGSEALPGLAPSRA